MDNNKVICHYCVGEKYVKSVIKSRGIAKAPCSYCNKKRKNLLLSEIVDMMHQVFENYYNVNEQEHIYGWNNGDCAQEIIGEELEVDEEIIIDISDALVEKYNRNDGFEPAKYDDSYTYNGRGFSTSKLNQAWEKMKHSLNNEARYFNRPVKKFLDDLFSDLDDFRIGAEQSPIKTIDKEIPLYRARVFESLNEVEKALIHPERNFGPPPPELARSGRMNALGISVFYGATTPDVAISEVRPPVGSRVVVAPFIVRKPMRILDISALDSLIFSKESVFNPDTLKKLEKTAFLKTFSKKMTLPVFGRKQDSEYIITQAIAEYLSVSGKYRLDGISFRSTQITKKSKSKSKSKRNKNQINNEIGYNVVLFSKSSGVMYSEENERTYHVSIVDNPAEESSYFLAKIRQIEDNEESRAAWSVPAFTNKDKWLELNATGLIHYHIEGVTFQKLENRIEFGGPLSKHSKCKDNFDPDLEQFL